MANGSSSDDGASLPILHNVLKKEKNKRMAKKSIHILQLRKIEKEGERRKELSLFNMKKIL